MKVAANVHIALRALKVNKMRSGLTMLGVIIGVAAVIAMIAVGDGAQARIAEQIRSLGANLLFVRPGSVTKSGAQLGTGSKASLTEGDVIAIQREVPAVMVAAGSVAGSAQVVQGNVNWSTIVQGITPEFFLAREWEVTAGRTIMEEDVRGTGKVAVIGTTVAEKLFGTTDPIGQLIRVRNVPLTVIGVLEGKGQNAKGHDQDDVLMIPLSTAKVRVLGSTQGGMHSVNFILVKIYGEDAMAEAERQIRDLLRQRHRIRRGGEDDFRLRNLTQVAKTKREATRVLTLLLAAVASVSLIVGGISIMNIMLVSVTERTREIGLRLAVGAHRRDVRTQFLIEAVTLSIIGGTVGVVLGICVAAAIAEIAGWAILLRIEAIIAAFGFSATVGIFFGFYPARKASQLNPIDALRFE